MDTFSDSPHHWEDLHSWHILRPLLDAGDYLPWGTGSMRPTGLVKVCNEIVHRDRQRIVECGSGVSTVVLARLLQQRGTGTLVALEHDAGWAKLVTGLLERESLTEVARVSHAPLQGEPPWYSTDAVAELPVDIDLLIVDGPPADAPGWGDRRRPALEILQPRLTGDATVILDDVNRPGEQAVLTAWESDTDWVFSIDQAAGVAFGRRRSDNLPGGVCRLNVPRRI